MVFAPRRFEQILADKILRLVGRTALSDITDSSSVKQMLAASSREDDEIYFQMNNILDLFSIDTATGDDLDARAAEIQPGVITRIGARSANGTVVFSAAVAVTGTVTIPPGTKVKTTDGVSFTTTQSGEITPTSVEQIAGHGVGRDSAPVPVVADVPGADGNVVANTIIRFNAKPSGVDEVTNPLVTLNGRDQESDDSFRQRIKDYIAGLARCTVTALEVGVLGLEDEDTGASILFSKAVEDLINLGNVTLYIDDGTGAVETTDSVIGENVTEGLLGPPADSAVGGEEQLYLDNKPVKQSAGFTLTSSIRGALTSGVDYTLNPASGQLLFTPALVATEVITAGYTHYTGLIQEAQKVVDGDPNDVINYPGLRAAGVLVQVLAPTTVVITVTATVVVREGFDSVTALSDAENAVAGYINALGISDDVVRSEIIARIQSLDAIADVNVTVPAGNIAVLDDQLPRITSGNITIT